MEKNAYLSRLKPLENNDLYQNSIVNLTSHCSGELQKNLSGIGQLQMNDSLTALSNAMVSLIGQEEKMLDSVAREYVGPHGSNSGFVGPGFSIHSACLLGSHQYLLHHTFRATEDCYVLYISRPNMLHALNNANQAVIEKLVDEL